MPPPDDRRSRCPIAGTLDILGDKWTLLVIRDMVLSRKRHFREFLDSPEGIASNILTDRLKRLEEAGVVARRPDPDSARQVIYTLTEKGRDLNGTTLRPPHTETPSCRRKPASRIGLSADGFSNPGFRLSPE